MSIVARPYPNDHGLSVRLGNARQCRPSIPRGLPSSVRHSQGTPSEWKARRRDEKLTTRLLELQGSQALSTQTPTTQATTRVLLMCWGGTCVLRSLVFCFWGGTSEKKVLYPLAYSLSRRMSAHCVTSTENSINTLCVGLCLASLVCFCCLCFFWHHT